MLLFYLWSLLWTGPAYSTCKTTNGTLTRPTLEPTAVVSLSAAFLINPDLFTSCSTVVVDNSVTRFLSLFWSFITSFLVFALLPPEGLHSPPFLCNVFFYFYLWAFRVQLGSLQCHGGLKNAQRLGERDLLQPPLLLPCSHFPEILLPGLTGFPQLPQLPDRQWEPQEVRGGDWNHPRLDPTAPTRDMTWEGCAKYLWLECWLSNLFNTMLFVVFVLPFFPQQV